MKPRRNWPKLSRLRKPLLNTRRLLLIQEDHPGRHPSLVLSRPESLSTNWPPLFTRARTEAQSCSHHQMGTAKPTKQQPSKLRVDSLRFRPKQGHTILNWRWRGRRHGRFDKRLIPWRPRWAHSVPTIGKHYGLDWRWRPCRSSLLDPSCER